MNKQHLKMLIDDYVAFQRRHAALKTSNNYERGWLNENGKKADLLVPDIKRIREEILNIIDNS